MSEIHLSLRIEMIYLSETELQITVDPVLSKQLRDRLTQLTQYKTNMKLLEITRKNLNFYRYLCQRLYLKSVVR